MKAAWYTNTGPAQEVLRVGEQPTPQAGSGEVRVRLHASGVNPSDCNRRAGRWPMQFPLVIPDSDGSGIVDQVGRGADPSLLGQRVWLYNGQRGGRAFGTAAEWIALDAGLVAPLPDGYSFEQGACLGVPGMTAWHCVFMDGPVEGRTVLVQGGAGAVGHFAVQLAAWAGARVIATVSGERKAAHARAAGAAEVIDRSREDVAQRVLDLTGGAGVERIVEVDLGGNLQADLRVIKANGRIAAYASRGDPPLPWFDLMSRNVSIHAVLLNSLPLEARRAAQDGMVRWLRTARALVAVSETLPLERIADAHQAVEAGTKLGTVVVRCA
ncbi:MAG TPA: NADPH:quinone reductase [Ramlibacter sp.]|nr:NADPH:quinone reductase [Ramlibacter sp.]